MREIAEKQICSGCGACENACPKRCITMQSDSEGFLYPHIDEEKCIDCGKCGKICPVLNEYKGNPKGRAYACINKDDDTRMQSSSGGVFTLLAEYVLEKGGAVFGAAFDETLNVRHTVVVSKDELYRLRGSKYVQSRIGDTYKSVKEYLNGETPVLFTGTPCQISGLKAYLGKEYDNLITQDIICHGVPSPGIWQKYLNHLTDVDKSNPPNFRSKHTGWESYSLRINLKGGKNYIQYAASDLYMKAFLNDLCLRPSCYQCHSKSLERESDITLADFWGVENIVPDMFDNKGTSLVFVNSAKGQKLFDAAADKMICKPVSLDEAVKYNSSAYKPAEENKKRSGFMQEIQDGDFESVVKKYTKQPMIRRCLRKIKGIIRKVCK